ncbi:MAG: phenylalanine--tRNA ligase subunit beta [Deltaproteobacteria bacterium]|nr:phenylalanine--tRNA ligase subunit beta [Deltaproteobacteria bacterium]
MKISLNWLKQWVNVSDSPESIADRMTMVGLEAASVEPFGVGYDDIVIGRILKIEQHPNAEKLALCDVTVGGEEKLSIICGAKNIYEGAVVPVALIGSTLPNGMKIKRSKIRGVASEGMICSEEELGLEEHSTGIMLLPEDLPLGKPFFEITGLKDTLIDFEITPNRGDCLSILGIAREVAAVYDLPLKEKEIPIEETGEAVADAIQIEIENTRDCPRYCARLVRNVKIGPSPLWLKEKLIKLGFRSINNVVDITNYVLLELGQPLHAFDYDTLRGKKIIVRSASEGEKFVTLDEKERTLTTRDLLICDAEGPVAIAGVMGGLNSEVTDKTCNILIESAYFRPGAIRHTAKRLGLPTEASYRFEREIDPDGVIRAADLAASMMAELAGGEVAPGLVDADYREKKEEIVELSTEYVRATLGLEIGDKEIEDILRRLFMKPKEKGQGLLNVVVPSFRRDVTRAIDLVEEIGRIAGFDKIPDSLPSREMDAKVPDELHILEGYTRRFLIQQGYFETINYSFISPTWLDDLNIPEGDPLRRLVKLKNPISEDMSVLRTFLVPSLINTARNNFNYKIQDIKIFEFRKVFFSSETQELPEEHLHLAGLVMGKNPYTFGFERHPFDFLDVKGDIEGLCETLRIENVKYSVLKTPIPFLHPGISAEIVVEGAPVGFVGKMNPAVIDTLKIDENVYCFELDFVSLLNGRRKDIMAQEISKYPPISRDIALVVDTEMPVGEIIERIYSFQNKYLKRIELFDIYIGKEIPKGKKSVAFRVTYQALQKTLKDKEVDKIHRQLASFLIEKGDIQLR